MCFSHIDADGNAVMVDVTEKAATHRRAVAAGSIRMNEEAFAAVRDKTARKGDVLGVAQVAGIMATKETSRLIPLCHGLGLTASGLYRTVRRKDGGGDGGADRGNGGPAHHLRYV